MFVCHCQDVELGGQSRPPATRDPAQEGWRAEGGETSATPCFCKLRRAPSIITHHNWNLGECLSMCEHLASRRKKSLLKTKSSMKARVLFGSVLFWHQLLSSLKNTPAVSWQPQEWTNPSQRPKDLKGTGERQKDEIFNIPIITRCLFASDTS